MRTCTHFWPLSALKATVWSLGNALHPLFRIICKRYASISIFIVEASTSSRSSSIVSDLDLFSRSLPRLTMWHWPFDLYQFSLPWTSGRMLIWTTGDPLSSVLLTLHQLYWLPIISYNSNPPSTVLETNLHHYVLRRPSCRHLFLWGLAHIFQKYILTLVWPINCTADLHQLNWHPPSAVLSSDPPSVRDPPWAVLATPSAVLKRPTLNSVKLYLQSTHSCTGDPHTCRHCHLFL